MNKLKLYKIINNENDIHIDNVSSLIISKNNKVLLLRMTYGNEKYSYTLGGGHLDNSDKNPWKGVQREFSEETGIKIKNDEIYSKYENGKIYYDYVGKNDRITRIYIIKTRQEFDEDVFKKHLINQRQNREFIEVNKMITIPYEKFKNIIFGLDDEIPIVSYVIHSTKEIFKKKILK